jgi:hypothetical protein
MAVLPAMIIVKGGNMGENSVAEIAIRFIEKLNQCNFDNLSKNEPVGAGSCVYLSTGRSHV